MPDAVAKSPQSFMQPVVIVQTLHVQPLFSTKLDRPTSILTVLILASANALLRTKDQGLHLTDHGLYSHTSFI